MAKSLVAAALIVPAVIGALGLAAASSHTQGLSTIPQSTAQNPSGTTGARDPGSPDERARATEARMTDDERFSLLISILGTVPGGAMPPDPRVRGVKNQSAGYTPGIPRLGIPALQSSDASMGVTNPGYRPGKPCVYVGMTGLDPDVRFDKHKAGLQANRYVQRFGLRLLPEIYAAYNPMSYDDARDMEVELAIDLREGGYGVWQA